MVCQIRSPAPGTSIWSCRSTFSATFAQHRFSQIHQVMVILVGLIELQHGELRIVPRRHAFIPEIAVDFEHFLDATDYQALQIKLRRNAKIQFACPARCDA